MKRWMCNLSDDDDGRSTNLENLLEKLIDSVLLTNNKLEGLSSRVDKLEEKVNEEVLLGRKERDEFMNEVKSELTKLKKSQGEEQTVHVDSHLVSKLLNLQNENDLHVESASGGEGWRTWRTSHLDVQEPSQGYRDLNSWDKHLNVEELNQVDSPWNSPQPKRQKAVGNELRKDLTSGSKGKRRWSASHWNRGYRDLNSWDKHLNVENDLRNENDLHVESASAGQGWRPWSTSHLDVQQPNHGNRDLNSWDKPFNVHQLNHPNEYYSSHRNMDSNSWDKHLKVQQPNQLDDPWNSLQPKQQKPVDSKSPKDIASGSEGWRTSTSHLDVLNCDKSKIIPSEDHWRPPGENVTKVNVGVVPLGMLGAACGVVARGHSAEFEGCCTKLLWHNSYVEAVAGAFLAAVEFAVSININLSNVIIEGDIKSIIPILNDPKHFVPWSIRSVVERIRKLVEETVPSIEFRFVEKSGNMVAHTLASHAKSNMIAETWLSSPPPIITSLLNAEGNR